MSDAKTQTQQVNLSGEAIPKPDIAEDTETKEYRILMAGRYFVKLTEETWGKLLESKKEETPPEHHKRVKNWVQAHAKVMGKSEVPDGTYDQDCKSLFDRIMEGC